MKKTVKAKPRVVKESLLPEVEEFMEAQLELEEFQARHGEVFDEFSKLVTQYNSARAKAEKACREAQVSSGPFQICGDNSKGDWEELAKIIGDKNFIALGGEISRKTSYKMENDRFRLLVETGKIDTVTKERVFTEGVRFKAPKEAVLPA